ncbi:MAG: Crp/Fnr family transcriptional regulator, partial [Bdellovibrionales bacterium]
MEFKQLWSDLNLETRSHFESHSRTLEFKRGENVYIQGDTPKGIYFVNSGLVGLMKTGVSGKEHLLRFFRQGQFFGHRALFSNEGYHGTAIVLEPTQIKLVPKLIVLE